MPGKTDPALVDADHPQATPPENLSVESPKPNRKGSMIPLVAIAIALALSSVITDSCDSNQPVSISTPNFEKVTLSTTISTSMPEPSVAVASSSESGSESSS